LHGLWDIAQVTPDEFSRYKSFFPEDAVKNQPVW